MIFFILFFSAFIVATLIAKAIGKGFNAIKSCHNNNSEYYVNGLHVYYDRKLIREIEKQNQIKTH